MSTLYEEKWKMLAWMLAADQMQIDIPDDDGSPEAVLFRGMAEDLFGAEARRHVMIHDFLRRYDPQPFTPPTA